MSLSYHWCVIPQVHYVTITPLVCNPSSTLCHYHITGVPYSDTLCQHHTHAVLCLFYITDNIFTLTVCFSPPTPTHSFMQRPSPPVIWTGKNEYGWVEIWVDRWWTDTKLKEQKRSSQTIINIVSYALKVSVNGVTCVL